MAEKKNKGKIAIDKERCKGCQLCIEIARRRASGWRKSLTRKVITSSSLKIAVSALAALFAGASARTWPLKYINKAIEQRAESAELKEGHFYPMALALGSLLSALRRYHHEFPNMYRVRQTFDRTRVQDIPGTVKNELKRLALEKKVKPGQRVALTAGSRGVANIAVILKAAVEYLKSIGRQTLYLSRPWEATAEPRPRGRPTCWLTIK